jgi:hypothetical protein
MHRKGVGMLVSPGVGSRTDRQERLANRLFPILPSYSQPATRGPGPSTPPKVARGAPSRDFINAQPTVLASDISRITHCNTAYDAAYVALAENLGARLLTRDARLASASGLTASIELF